MQIAAWLSGWVAHRLIQVGGYKLVHESGMCVRQMQRETWVRSRVRPKWIERDASTYAALAKRPPACPGPQRPTNDFQFFCFIVRYMPHPGLVVVPSC